MEDMKTRQGFGEYLSECYPLNLLLSIHPEQPDIITSDIRIGLEYILTTLSDREQEILRLRFRERRTRSDIAEEFCITQERVRQIEAKALRKLRHPNRYQFVRLGMMGYIRHIREKENKLGYKKGYDKGYKDGMEDAAKGKTYHGVLAEIAAQPIDNLDLSIRAYNSLLRLGCKTIGDCMLLKKDQILNVRNLGKKTRIEIASALQEREVVGTVWDEFVVE